jgi:hypothetical protein
MSAQGGSTLLRLVDVATPVGPRRAVVAAPARPVRLDRARLERMRAGNYASAVNDDLLEFLKREPVSAILFDGGSPDWGFTADLSDDEVSELGFHMLRSQLRLFRDAARCGVHVVVGVGLGAREVYGYLHGAERLQWELESRVAKGEADAALARLDLWLLDRMTLWTALGADAFLDERLAEVLVGAVRRRKRLDTLLALTAGGAS